MSHFSKSGRLICTALLCIIAVVGAGLLYCALNYSYDIQIRHFDHVAPLATAAVTLSVVGAVLALVLALVTHFSHSEDAPSASASITVFAAALLGFLLLASFIFSIRTLTALSSTWLERIRLALMALSAFYFLWTMQKSTLTPAAGILTLCPILYAFLSVMCVYFDESYAMNAPVKSYQLMMYLAMALFFTAEARNALGRFKPITYALSAGLCIVLCGIVGGAQLVTALHDTLGHGFSLTESAVACASALFAAARLFTMRAKDSTPTEVSHEQA